MVKTLAWLVDWGHSWAFRNEGNETGEETDAWPQGQREATSYTKGRRGSWSSHQTSNTWLINFLWIFWSIPFWKEIQCGGVKAAEFVSWSLKNSITLHKLPPYWTTCSVLMRMLISSWEDYGANCISQFTWSIVHTVGINKPHFLHSATSGIKRCVLFTKGMIQVFSLNKLLEWNIPNLSLDFDGLYCSEVQFLVCFIYLS